MKKSAPDQNHNQVLQVVIKHIRSIFLTYILYSSHEFEKASIHFEEDSDHSESYEDMIMIVAKN